MGERVDVSRSTGGSLRCAGVGGRWSEARTVRQYAGPMTERTNGWMLSRSRGMKPTEDFCGHNKFTLGRRDGAVLLNSALLA
jgi:hypothetical protein